VHIPAIAKPNFPVLETAGTCKDIYFEAGAELGRQDLLTYTNAHIEYKIHPSHRYYMLSIPLTGIMAGHFNKGGNPPVYMKEFYLDGTLAAWKNITDPYKSLPLGGGFAFRAGGSEEISVNLPVGPAYRLAGSAPIEEPLLFGSDEKYGDSHFALAGNPFLTSIDYDALVAQNSDVITPNYLLWNEGKAYTGHTPDGNWGAIEEDQLTDIGNTRSIAPLQSFIVEEGDNTGSLTALTFDITDEIDVIAATGQGQLRSAANTSDKLNIIASNETGSILTFIANREYGQATVSKRDARKLFADLNNVPDIYTLKDSENGEVALGANIIDSNNALIPLGLLTNYTGKIKFTLKGMDSYDATIYFIDGDTQIDITGLDTYEYEFDYAPTTENGKAVADNNRFSIQFAPNAPTGLNKVTGQTTVYSRNHIIYATSASSLIRQIWVYNLQGKLVYVDKNIDALFCSVPLTTTIPDIYVVKLITDDGVTNSKLINK
jgi:hypothetical protein